MRSGRELGIMVWAHWPLTTVSAVKSYTLFCFFFKQSNNTNCDFFVEVISKGGNTLLCGNQPPFYNTVSGVHYNSPSYSTVCTQVNKLY